MSDTDHTKNPYFSALRDLRAKRDEIDRTIAFLEGMSGIGPTMPGPADEPPQDSGKSDAGAFLGMSIVDATKKLLAMKKHKMGNADIAAALDAGGLAMTSKDPTNTVGSVLTRRFKEVGDVVKVGRGVWGLKEWYPNRTLKANGKPDEPEKTEAPDMDREEAKVDQYRQHFGLDDDL